MSPHYPIPKEMSALQSYSFTLTDTTASSRERLLSQVFNLPTIRNRKSFQCKEIRDRTSDIVVQIRLDTFSHFRLHSDEVSDTPSELWFIGAIPVCDLNGIKNLTRNDSWTVFKNFFHMCGPFESSCCSRLFSDFWLLLFGERTFLSPFQ